MATNKLQNNNNVEEIPTGDIKFFDNYILPDGFGAGNYTISIEQTLTNGSTIINDPSAPLSTTQDFVVSGPQFTIDTSQIINMYPPKGATGEFGEVLPHVVLKDPMLPWERAMSLPNVPWLALLVFTEDELTPGDNQSSLAFSSTVDQFLKLGSTTLLAPKPAKELDINGSTSCAYIQFKTDLFKAIAPHIDELPYLSHVRKVNTDGRSMLGISEEGIYSVTASNRFAAAPQQNAEAIKSIVHLVSLEGMDAYLTAGADFKQYTDVALITLASWSFYSLPDISQDFAQLAKDIVASEKSNPDNLWLKMPAALSAGDAASKEISSRINNGYVPLAYHTRSGENTFAWYRGPLAPVVPNLLAKPLPFFKADAALIYDNANGVFDVSLASAWEAGRQAALSDKYFGQKLLSFRKKAHRLTDTLQYKLNSDHFTATQIEQVENSSTVQDTFLSLLTPQLIKDIGAIPESTQQTNSKQQATDTPTDPIADTKAFLGTADVQNKLMEMVADDLAPVAEWLGRLMLLYPIPFDNLVANTNMLPTESLRFFYIDQNWIDAAIDGALSLGLESSRETFFAQSTKSLIHQSALQAAAVQRDKLLGIKVAPNPALPNPDLICGFLLRSALVTGWPNLVIKAKDNNDNTLKILRLDHLSNGVLFCLLDGVPDNIEFSQPQESICFGVDDDGNVVIRNVSDAAKLGEQIKLLKIRNLHPENDQNVYCMRALNSRVLNITPTDKTGLVSTLSNATVLPTGVNTLSPSIFAMQMIKSAEAFVFNSIKS